MFKLLVFTGVQVEKLLWQSYRIPPVADPAATVALAQPKMTKSMDIKRSRQRASMGEEPLHLYQLQNVMSRITDNRNGFGAD